MLSQNKSHNASKRLYAEKYSQVKHYMIFRKIPLELRKRISDYYENRYQGEVFKIGPKPERGIILIKYFKFTL